MAEVRRSRRANKGKHSKFEQEQLEIEEALRLAEEEAEQERQRSEEGHVLCMVCGTTDNNYDAEEERDMIQCDECKTWQHNECILEDPSIVPKIHLCNLCDPDNEFYKTLDYELDVEEVKKEMAKDALKKQKKEEEAKKLLAELEAFKKGRSLDEEDDQMDHDHDGASEEEGSSSGSDDDDDNEDDEDDPDAEPQKKVRVKKERTPKRSKSAEPKPVKKRKVSSPPPASTSLSHDEIEQKARQAVKKRFEGMFQKLLPGYKSYQEEDKVREFSEKWSVKLEESLYNAYHDPETGKLTRDYKEVSTRIFVNVKDEKNTKLRNSIINKTVPFDKLVRMPVNELLNPDLRKEKEEAIKESMSHATLEKAQVSNIRRTHKGDILIEKEDSSASASFDFNVGMHLDEDEKRFTQSEDSLAKSERKPSMYDTVDDDHDEPFNADAQDDHHDETTPATTITVEEDDDELAAILGETKKKIEEKVDSYDPSAVSKDATLWEGQTIFIGMTNFASTLHYKATTLVATDFQAVSKKMVDPLIPMEVEGRLDAKKADDYLLKVSGTRKLVLLELKPQTDGDKANFKKLFDYFYLKAKFGVVKSTQKFVKDSYLVPISSHSPKFMRALNLQDIGAEKSERLFVVFVVRQELVHQQAVENDGYDPAETVSKTGEFDFLSSLGANEMAVVNKIFDTTPQAKKDPLLLIQQLQQMLASKQS